MRRPREARPRASVLLACLLWAAPPAVEVVGARPLAAQERESRSEEPGVHRDSVERAFGAAASPPVPAARSHARPPARPPADVFDVLSFPLRVAVLPLTAAGKALQGLVVLVGRGEGTGVGPELVRDLRTWGLTPRLLTLGPRSGPGLGFVVSRWDPFEARTAISIRGSQRHEVGVWVGRGDGEVWLSARFRRYAEPRFWGIGPDTEAEDVAEYRWDRVEMAAGARVWTGAVGWRAELAYEENGIGRGSGGSVPDLLDVTPAGELVGLDDPPRFGRVAGGVTLDATRARGFQRRGVRASLESTLFLDPGATDADFLRADAELIGYLPLNARQQLALRGVVESNRPLGDGAVPFTHLASLGGGTSLRGFDRDRFRDRDLAALQGEWRYEVWRSIRLDLRQEGFLFLDGGAVADGLERIEASPLRSAYGFGMRTVDADGDPVAVWHLAFGGEGIRFRVTFSWPF